MARWFKILFFLFIANMVFETLVVMDIYATGMEGISNTRIANITKDFQPGNEKGEMGNWMGGLPTDPLNYLAGFVINGFTILTKSIYSMTIGAYQFYINLLYLIIPVTTTIAPIATLLTITNYIIIFFGLIEFARGPVGMT